MKQTPDLTHEFHPYPKPTKKEKTVKKQLLTGKRTQAWKDGIKELKRIFAEHHITACEINNEGCLRINYLGFAHVKRRINYDDDELADPKHVVLACQQCHYTVDLEMPKKEAEELLANIVKARAW